jgi:opacity protein-like surface antigen
MASITLLMGFPFVFADPETLKRVCARVVPGVTHYSGDTVNRFILSTLVAATVGAAAPAAQAQFTNNPFQIGGAAGVGFPTSDLGNAANTGFNVTVALGYSPRLLPIGLRAEAGYNEFGNQVGGGNTNIAAFTGNAIFALPAAGFTPYVIGGAGLYRVGARAFGNSGSENDFGFNIGGGVKIPLSSSFETFVEARYNRVSLSGNNSGSLSFVPVTVGIMW